MPVIYLVGDSTVTDNTPPFRGWGFALPAFCQEGVSVQNHAWSGCSSRSFLDEGRFDPIRQAMQSGDLLLIQFGHNDEKKDAPRHTDPGSSFPEQLSVYLDAAEAVGAQPVLLTPVSRRLYTEDDHIKDTHGDYPDAIRALAERRGVPLVDLLCLSRALFDRLGRAATSRLFVELEPGEHPDFPDGHKDPTHFNADGAQAICSLVVDALREDGRFTRWLRPEG